MLIKTNDIIDDEKCLLGCILYDNAVIYDISRQIDSTFFYFEQHQIIFNIIKNQIINENIKSDPLTIFKYIKDTQTDPKILNFAYISSLANTVSTASNYTFYLNRVKSNHKIVILSNKIDDISDRLKKSENIEDLTKELKSTLDTLETSAENKNIFTQSDLDLFLDDLKSTENNIIKTKFLNLTLGEFFIIAARPSIGKTSFALNLFEDLIFRDVSTCFISIEMSKNKILQRLYSISSQKNQNLLYAMKTKTFTSDQEKEIDNITAYYQSKTFSIVENVNDISKIESIINQQINNQNAKVFFIDYIGLIRDNDNLTAPKWQQIQGISQRLQHIAKTKNICLVGLCQLTRESENDKKRDKEGNQIIKEPTLNELRDSGSLEQDADIVALLYGLRDQRERFLSIEKNRNGETSKLNLDFDLSTQKFNLR